MKISPWLLPHGIAMESKWDNEILYTESSESYKLLYWRQSYLLLLFSHFVVSDSLAIPWAIAWASQVALVVICLPMHEMQEMWVWSLGREDSLEKGTATHSSILAWRISWTEDPGGHMPPKSVCTLREIHVLVVKASFHIISYKVKMIWHRPQSILNEFYQISISKLCSTIYQLYEIICRW